LDSSLAALLLRWHWRPTVLLVLLTLGGAYVRGWRRLRRQGGAPLAGRWRLAAYLGGLAAIAIALLSPLEPLTEVLFTAHMLQHQLLLMVAPPLLLLGNPFPVVLWGLPRAWRLRVGSRLTRSSWVRRAWRYLTWMPVAGFLYTVNLWAWHWPAAYDLALRHPLVHDVEHLVFFGTAVLFWWPVVNPAPRLHRLTTGLQYGYRIAYLILATAQNTLLGAVLGLAEHVLYPFYAEAPRLPALPWSPLDDQAFGGGVMWSGSHMFLIGILVLVSRALGSEHRERSARVTFGREQT
jgi:putative membrane protein